MPLGNGERYYSSGLGRFIQQDSFSGVLSVPASLNRYSYAHNNPVIHTDPSGNVIPLLIGLAVFGLAFYAGVKAVETRDTVEARNQEMIKQGVDPSTLPNANIVGIFDGSFVGSGFRFATGTDPVTGEDLSWKWRVFEGVITAAQVIGPLKSGLRGGVGRSERAASELLEESATVANTTKRALSVADSVAEDATAVKRALTNADELNDMRPLRQVGQATDEVADVSTSNLSDKLEASSSNVLRFTDDPLVDANTLIYAQNKVTAVEGFLNANRGLLSYAQIGRYEFLRKIKGVAKGTQKELTELAKNYNLSYLDTVNYKQIILRAKQLRERVSRSARGSRLSLKDSRQLATAEMLGIDFVTTDLGLFKRAKDLGIRVHYLDAFPGLGGTPSKAAQKAARYVPEPL